MSPAEAVRGFLDALGGAAGADPGRPGRPGRRCTAACWPAGGSWWCWTTPATPSRSGRCCPATPGCLVVVTSRNGLTGPGRPGRRAHPFTLDVLTPDEARRCWPAARAVPAWRAEPGASTRSSRRCARLPLALAIVAARAATHPRLPLAELAARAARAAGASTALEVGGRGHRRPGRPRWSYRALGDEAAPPVPAARPAPGSGHLARAAASLAGVAPGRSGPRCPS